MCKICAKNFKSRKSLNCHLRIVHFAGLFPCDFCDKTFKNTVLRKYHFDYAHNEHKKKKCDFCDKVFVSNSVRFKEHKWQRHLQGSAAHICHFCPKSFATLSHFNLHLKKYHEGGAGYKCKFCDMKFKSKQKKKLHIKQIHLTCQICNKTFVRPKFLNSHKKNAHNDTSLCKICNEKCKKLDLHMERVHQEVPCDICNRTFKGANAKRIHHKNVHDNQRKQKCDSCEKVYLHKSNLIQHQWKKHGQEFATHICHFCAKAFPTITHFNYHFQQRHNSGDGFNCSHCNMNFKLRVKLNAHQRQLHKFVKAKSEKKIHDIQEKETQAHEMHMIENQNDAQDTHDNCAGINKHEVTNDKIESLEQNNEHTSDDDSEAKVKPVVINFSKDVIIMEDSSQYSVQNEVISTKEVNFKCNICGKRFETILKLENHV